MTFLNILVTLSLFANDILYIEYPKNSMEKNYQLLEPTNKFSKVA